MAEEKKKKSFCQKCCACLTCKFVGSAFESMKEMIKFSTWKLRNQILAGVSCSLCCVMSILGIVINMVIKVVVDELSIKYETMLVEE